MNRTSALKSENENAASLDSWRVCADRNQSYLIETVTNVFHPVNEHLASLGADRKRRIVVLDSGLPGETKSHVADYFSHFGIDAEILLLPGGELAKDFKNLWWLLEKFDSLGLHRDTQPVIVIGGGAVLDVAGFAASIYRRGVPYIRIPTTLLAYIDASVGVKTGINLGSGKNLVGSFAPPHAVLLDPGFFATLDQSEIVSGLGEVFKLAVGCDASLFSELELSASAFKARDFSHPDVALILQRSIDIMLADLSPNLYEGELRRRVDLGHSFSQPLELGGPCLRHGEAVAIDILISSIISKVLGLLEPTDVDRIWALGALIGHPVGISDIHPDELWRSIEERSRHRGGMQRLPMPSPIGNCVFVDNLTRQDFDIAFVEFLERIK